MPTLSDKLKALGVKVGAGESHKRPPRTEFPIETVIPGRLVETDTGSAFAVDYFYEPDFDHSPRAYNLGIQLRAPLNNIAKWADEPIIARSNLHQIAFLDTETSGLSGGTGTYAFLVGAGKFEEGQFHLVQFFMRDPSEEASLLLALEEFLAPCTTLVTYNGKSFDIPLLNTRFRMQGWNSPVANLAQIDLLHLSRRLWRDRIPSRTLGNIEHQILGTERSEQEVPGWMIPQMYFDYLHSGDARPMKQVLYHNEIDVLSLAALLDHCAHLLSFPLDVREGEEIEQAAVGRIFEDLGDLDQAVQIYEACMQKQPYEALYWEVVQRLSFIFKRQDKKSRAMDLWSMAAQQGQVYAHVELAKVFEHERKDFSRAISWTEAAIEIITKSNLPAVERNQWFEELEHRLHRLKNKQQRTSNATQSSKEE